MTIFILDAETDARAAEAVNLALPREVERLEHKRPLLERLDAFWTEVDELGPRDPALEMKAFSDEMWGGE